MGDRQPPLWRQIFDTAERQISPRLGEVYRSEEFATAIALAADASNQLSSRVQREAHRLRHAVNQPSATDVRRLTAELRAVRADIRELRAEVNGLRERGTDG